MIKKAILSFSALIITQASSALTQSADSGSYCVALRGNGESEPSHWGALAQLIEKRGLPSRAAGGSSATVTFFWLDAMMQNSEIQDLNDQEKAAAVSLMLKSLLGFTQEMSKTQDGKNLTLFLGEAQKLKDSFNKKDSTDGDLKNYVTKLKSLSQFVDSQNWESATKLIQKGSNWGLINLNTVNDIATAIKEKNKNLSLFLISELKTSIQVFGAFNAATDNNLFFRSGVIDFKQLSSAFAKVAAFYSTKNATSETKELWRRFFSDCSGNTENLSWPQIQSQKPFCEDHLHIIFDKYFQDSTNVQVAADELLNQEIGKSLNVIATTAVITNSSVDEVDQAFKDYREQMRSDFGKSFYLKNANATNGFDAGEVKFGYWGEKKILQAIERGLKENFSDPKSARFFPLGSATWRDILAISPAEPGLAPLQKFNTSYGQKLYSAGGWSDLHPILALKASGCENVIYVTRKGGESLFAQGIAKRLLNLDRSWNFLETTPKEKAQQNSIINNEGDPADLQSLWSNLYNLGNPNSAFNQSIKNASEVLCTNWNDFDVKSQFIELIEDSYRSPLIKISKQLKQTGKIPGCTVD